jgi:ribosomal protein L11 methyltransferase
MDAYWLEVAVVCDGEAAEAVAELLHPLAYGDSVVFEQEGDPSALDEDALEPQVTVKIFIAGDQDTPGVRQNIREALYYLSRLYPIPEPSFREVADKDWAHAWKEHYHPFRVGARIWIQPSWVPLSASVGADDVVLRLDPGMAFGTGLHPTTQMCLRALPELVIPGATVLDVGTGSGILAIAAAKLGARRVLGVDTDAQAVRAARENVTQNDVGDKVDIQSGSLEILHDGVWRVVIVNILAPVIVGMLQGDGGRRKLLDVLQDDGYLLLSGIIDRQEGEVREALTTAGAAVVKTRRVRDWVSLVARRTG